MATETEYLKLFKYHPETDSENVFSIHQALNMNWDKIDAFAESAGRNIGEIVTSTIPLTNAGLHLLDGSLIQGDGIYSDFYEYIVSLYEDYPQIFADESGWQQDVQNFGVCGKFVFNTTNRTVRLPKITGIIEGTTDLSVLDHMVHAGLPALPQHTHTYVDYYAYFEQGHGGEYPLVSSGNTLTTRTTNNASTVTGGLYGTSSTVQPQTIRVLYYIVIANSIKTDIQVDIDDIATDLNGKADVDLTNVSNTGYIKMAGAGMPSNTYIDLTLGASGVGYIAPANGWFVLEKIAWTSDTTSVNPKYIEMINNSSRFTDYSTANWQFACCCSCPAKKGDAVYVGYDCVGTTIVFRFIYATGSESEAS